MTEDQNGQTRGVGYVVRGEAVPDDETGDGTGPDPVPGDLSDLAYGSLLGDAAELRAQWHQIQFMFVDDPRGSVSEAADVIAQVSAKLEAAIQERLRAIQDRQRSLRDRWGEGVNADTETLRETLRMYRNFLDQLTGSTGPTEPRGPRGPRGS